MQRILKKIKLHTIALLLGAIVFAMVGVRAATTLSSKSVYYDNSTSGSTKTNIKDAIDDLYSKTKMISFKVGDYVKMTPTKTSFVVPKTLTGYTENQTINPSELNLWRVIRINSDGTVDMVSQYTSSNNLFFYNLDGYKNLVGVLNLVSKQYVNNKFTVASRNPGYINQTEYITNTSKFINPAPWTTTTSNNNNESLGGGDISYTTDNQLIKTAIGNLIAYSVDNKTSGQSYYWLASREYNYVSTTHYRWCGRRIDSAGNNNITYFYNFYNTSFGINNYANTAAKLRPILTLGTNIRGTGAGTSASPYVLS